MDDVQQADHVERKGTSSAGVLSKRIRQSYDSNFKVAVSNFAETSNNSIASRKFGISEANVRRWKAMKNKLANANSTRRTFRGPKQGRFPEVDQRVVEYVREKRNLGFPITREVLKFKALEVATEQNIPRAQFKASNGWCLRMMKRAGLALCRRTTLAQRLPSDFNEKLLAYQRYVINLRKQHDYLLSQMGNADQTPVSFDMPTNVTVNEKGAKSVVVRTTGNEKLRITVMLCVLADGRKLPPYVILKRKTLPKENLPNGVIFRCQDKGWMTSDLVLDWLRVVWNRRPGVLLRQRGMLVLDAFSGHLTKDVKNEVREMNTDLVVIPGGMTSQLQVLDVCINKPFKDGVRSQYVEWLLENNHALTPTGKIRKPSIALLGQWILTAFHRLPPEMIIRGFKKCCISNDMNGMEDDILWEDEGRSGEDSASENESSDNSEKD